MQKITRKTFDDMDKWLDETPKEELDRLSIASMQAYIDAGGRPDIDIAMMQELMPPICDKCKESQE